MTSENDYPPQSIFNNNHNTVSDAQSATSTLAQTGLQGLSQYLKSQNSEPTHRCIPPLEKWHPKHCGAMDLVIKANGEWWHEGTKVTRQSLIDLFATVLWAEQTEQGQTYYLKTPVEKIKIVVEDVPFLVNDVNVVVDDDALVWIEFITSTGDILILDDSHPLVMRKFQGEMRPYILVRFGMLGLVGRNVFMHLTKIGKLSDNNGKTTLTLHSGGSVYGLSVSNNT